VSDASKAYGVTYYLTADDERYPTLVLKGDFGIVGYDLNKETGEIKRICVCAAYSSNECCCGAFDMEGESD
jgi:hypothetical protein